MLNMKPLASITPQLLDDEERATYEWQLWVDDHREEGQERLKGASVLISRVGGLGSPVAYELAAAGVGRLVLAHGGNVKPSDLNRQLLMTHDWLGKPRVESAARRLKELNPRLEVVTIPENVSDDNAAELVGMVDVVIDAAPLFNERFAMNREAVRQGKPMVEAAMYDLEAHLTTIVPGESPCLACLYPEDPVHGTRQFPVFGAVSGTIGCIAAMEAIKVISGFGDPLVGRLLSVDLRRMEFKVMRTMRDPECRACGGGAA